MAVAAPATWEKPGNETFGTGVTHPDRAEAGPMPWVFWALTEKRYGLPLVSPDTVQVVAADLQLAPPGAAVTVYVSADLPVKLGADQETETDPLPGVALKLLGTVGVWHRTPEERSTPPR
jgi:hypothetical protein